MNETELISGWLERNRSKMTTALSSLGEWLTLSDFKWKLSEELFPALLADWNKQKGSPARKPIESFISIARERGLRILTDYYQAEATHRGYLVHLEHEGGLIFELAEQNYYYYKAYGKCYLHPFNLDVILNGNYYPYSHYRCTMESPDVFAFLDYYTGVIEMAIGVWKHMEFEIKKEINVSALSYPLIENYLLKACKGKNIKYFIDTEGSNVIIYINIVKDLWYRGPITPNTMENIVRFAPYAVLRPDDRKVLGAGFKVERDYRGELEDRYKKYWKAKVF